MANRTFTVLTQVVGEFIGMPSDSGRGAYLAGLAINEAIDDQNMINYWFLETTVNFNLTAGARTYTLSTSWPNFRTHIKSEVLSSDGLSVEVVMAYIKPEEFFAAKMDTNTQTGLPRFLTVDMYNGLIRVDRAPGETRACRTLYRKQMPRLSGTATLGVDDSAENMIVQDAIWRVRRMARIDYAADKVIAMETQRRLLATRQSSDLLALGVFR